MSQTQPAAHGKLHASAQQHTAEFAGALFRVVIVFKALIAITLFGGKANVFWLAPLN